MNKKIKLGILGGGSDSFIGSVHRIAANMYDRYEVVGGSFSADYDECLEFADEIGLSRDRVYRDLDSMIAAEIAMDKDDRMEVVSVLTPNFLHFPMAKKLVENGIHVICEKPLVTRYEDAVTLGELSKKNNTVFAVTYTYTGYPMVRQAKEMIASGALGTIQKVDVKYYQGWMNPIIHDKAARADTWRLDPEKSGVSSCMGDIGTHAFNLVEFLTGVKVEKILADMNNLYEDNTMDLDGSVLLRLQGGVKGVLRASQIATGEENNLSIKIYGDKAGIKWEQENPNYLYFTKEGEPTQVYKPGHGYNTALSLDGTKLPPGHPEGIFDSMGNIYKGVARAIRGEEYKPGEFPTLEEGIRGVDFIHKSVESNAKGNVWVSIND